MTVRVLFFSILRDLTGVESFDLAIDAPEAKVGDAVSLLLEEFPRLQEWEDRLLLAVDCEYADSDEVLSDGCEFALFPPVQGGSEDKFAFHSVEKSAQTAKIMASWFYTDSEAQQQGAVDEEQLLELNRTGEIHAKSLVWQEGMEDWIPFRDIAPGLFGTDEEGRPIEIGVCAYSQKIYPVSEMMPYGEAVIGLEHKDAFIQRLMETGSIEIADASEKRFEYMGFWWRCLSSFLDYLIKMIPTWICMIPYYIVAFTGGLESIENEPSTGAIVALAVAYGIGLLGMLAVSIFYETWMVGKYQGTLGKLIIGARVVKPDGSRLSYKQAFVRWLAKKPLNYVIVWLPASIGVGIVIAAVAEFTQSSDGSATFGLAFFSAFFVFFALLGICLGVYWMAAFDSEKRTLHDRVASTRVIKK